MLTDRPPADDPQPDPLRVPCVGAVITDETGRLLLIRRGHEPGKGLWSIPGGRIEPGESDQQAVVREVSEETRLDVTCGRLLGSVELPGPAGAIVEVRDYLATVRPGTAAAPVAGDDAADAAWVTPQQLAHLETGRQVTAGLLTILRSWGAAI